MTYHEAHEGHEGQPKPFLRLLRALRVLRGKIDFGCGQWPHCFLCALCGEEIIGMRNANRSMRDQLRRL